VDVEVSVYGGVAITSVVGLGDTAIKVYGKYCGGELI
jgi:hypothetical protein